MTATIPDSIFKLGITPSNEALVSFLLMKGFRKGEGSVMIHTDIKWATQAGIHIFNDRWFISDSGEIIETYIWK